MDNKKVALKIVGILGGVIVCIVVLAAVFSLKIAPIMKYNTAVKNAEAGEYALAVKGLSELKSEYKDSEKKKQEYALEAGKQFMEEGNTEAATAYLGFAGSLSADSELAKEAQELFNELNK